MRPETAPLIPLPLGGGRYACHAGHDPAQTRVVDLNAGTCTCPEHALKAPAGLLCPHLKAARLAVYQTAQEKAKHLTAGAIRLLLARYDRRPELVAALLHELEKREEQGR